jgi:predicted nucleotide-binding protein (sugar kinase/HSP70/actin superfamily)
MINTIGIPRALLYYHYAPMLQAFFRTLGVQVIVSPPTTRETLAQGAARVVADMCMPVKLYCGHVLALVDKVDRIFVPAIHRLRPGTRNCPKFVGLPDLISAAIPEAPLLTVDVDTESRLQALSQLVQVLRKHFTINPLLVKKATDQAQADQNAYHKLLLQGVPLPEAITLSPLPRRLSQPRPLTVAVIGHPYNLHDEYVTHRLLRRLQSLNVRTRTPATVHPTDRWWNVKRLAQVPYWTFEDEVVGAAGSYLQRGVDGVITVSAFGCAPDSVMLAVVAQAARAANVPHISLILDEHSGEAGLVTRLEAFVDMLSRRKEREQCPNTV